MGADLPNPEGVGVLVHKETGINSVAELKGKKVGALKGGNHHYLAILAVEDAGLDVNDIEWVLLTRCCPVTYSVRNATKSMHLRRTIHSLREQKLI